MAFVMRKLSGAEGGAVLELLGKCFPEYWQDIAENFSKMPFEEISFGTFDGNDLVGHCGLVPHEVFADGNWYPVAGIASVAVASTHRKKGIARDICDFAANWAEENGYMLFPLYTEFFRVYETADWHQITIPATLERSGGKVVPQIEWKSGNQLTDDEKNNIISIYENGALFNGKVKRQLTWKIHSWENIFNADVKFAVADRMYAAQKDGVLAEIYFSGDVTCDEKKLFFDSLGSLPCYLPPTADVRMLMKDFQWEISTADAMHGERPMLRLPANDNPVVQSVEKIFFPLLDKF